MAMFNNYNLSDGKVLKIIERYEGMIDHYSIVNGKIDKNLKDEIITEIYLKLTKNRKK